MNLPTFVLRLPYSLTTVLLCSLILNAPTPSDSPTADTAVRYQLQLYVSGKDMEAGNLMVAIFDKSNTFLSDKALKERMVDMSKYSDEQLKFDLPPRRYAVAVYLDQNKNKELDRNFFGLPTEPYGFSNNPKGLMGPPSFAQTSFELSADMKLTIRLSN